MRDVGIGLVGTGFIAQCHAEAFKTVPAAALRGVASRTPGNAERFAAEHGIPRHHTDYRALIDQADVDVICIGAPNDLHCEITVAAASAGKHVICEKPLARTLAEADEMIAACSRAGVLLMYAEELCFAPKYVRAKELADEGALGPVYLVRQGEQHLGPHSDWFWDPERAGGGVLMDMGCHGIEFARWVYGKAPAESATAELGTFVHGGPYPGGGPRGRAWSASRATGSGSWRRAGRSPAGWTTVPSWSGRRGSPTSTSCAARRF